MRVPRWRVGTRKECRDVSLPPHANKDERTCVAYTSNEALSVLKCVTATICPACATSRVRTMVPFPTTRTPCLFCIGIVIVGEGVSVYACLYAVGECVWYVFIYVCVIVPFPTTRMPCFVMLERGCERASGLLWVG